LDGIFLRDIKETGSETPMSLDFIYTLLRLLPNLAINAFYENYLCYVNIFSTVTVYIYSPNNVYNNFKFKSQSKTFVNVQSGYYPDTHVVHSSSMITD